MQVFGNIAQPLRAVNGRNGVFYSTRLAESSGEGEQRRTTWYNLNLFISELDADLLSKGDFVKVTGRVEAQAYMGGPGKDQLMASLNLMGFGCEVVPKRNRAENGQEQHHA